MAKNVIWTTVFCVFAGVLQSTLFRRLAIYNAVPDIALVIVVFSAYVNGTMTGQLSGFCSGLMLDFLSASPLGLNIFIRTLIGAFTGMLKATFFMDPVFLPMALCAGATLFKAVLLFLLHFLFAEAVPAYSWTAPLLWIELALNAVLAPFLFLLLKQFRALLVTQTGRGG
jgi:rod shape-determining protein MreD